MRLMKDSGIEWIGLLPASWRLNRMGSMFYERSEKVSDIDFPPLSVTMKGVVPQLEHVAKSDDHFNRKLVRFGDFAINSRSDRRNSCGFSFTDGSVSLINTVLVPFVSMNSRYYEYLFKTAQFADEYYRLGHGIVNDLWTTKWIDAKRIELPLPSSEEQQIIADCLDKKCTEIDKAIEAAEASIEEYKLYKKSVIFQAVTKGLDPNVPMKDSGIEWIGMMPEAWATEQVGRRVDQTKRKNDGMAETNLLSLSYGKVRRRDINATEGLLPESFEGYNIIEENDIVLRFTDLQNDQKSLRVGRATERGIITSAYTTIRPFDSEDSKFLYYALHSYDLKKGFYGMGAGVRQGLKWQEAKYIEIPWPDNQARTSICRFLDSKCVEIDKAIEAKLQIIGELKAYKKSLIWEVVTGKSEVL